MERHYETCILDLQSVDAQLSTLISHGAFVIFNQFPAKLLKPTQLSVRDELAKSIQTVRLIWVAHVRSRSNDQSITVNDILRTEC